jgi:hypothetical protein
MAKGMEAIYTQVLTSSAGTVNFNNIPQTNTDLMIVASTRCDFASIRIAGAIRFNSDASSVYSDTLLTGDGSSAASGRSQTSFSYLIESTGTSATANTFGSNTIYIPNYTSTAFKQYASECISEHNGTNVNQTLYSGLYRSNAPITSLSLFPGGGANFIANSTFTLYGISR